MFKEKIKNNQILHLDISGFHSLSLKQKNLVYHLSRAGLYGRDIAYIQNSEYNLNVKMVLESIFRNLKKIDISEEVKTRFTEYLKLFWLNIGLHDELSGKKIDFPISEDEFNIMLSAVDFSDKLVGVVKKVFFENDFVKNDKTIQTDGIDVVENSAIGVYKNLNESDVKLYRDVNYEKTTNSPQHGFNSILEKLLYKEGSEEFIEIEKEFKNLLSDYERDIATFSKELESKNLLSDEDVIRVEELISNKKEMVKIIVEKLKDPKNHGRVIEKSLSVEGICANSIRKIIEELKYALNFVENEKQALSISTLITFYETGDPLDFDKHSLAWLEDNESDIFFINGFIETYSDPLGVVSFFESIVCYKNKEKTKKVQKIIDNIKEFEMSLPVEERFKKGNPTGLSASTVDVISMAGESSPILPRGVNLPNSEWIKSQHGTKSVGLDNVNGTDDYIDVFKEFFLPEYHESLVKYDELSSSLHTDLHEITGHGSCQSMEGVTNKDLGIYYAVLEECRADLVGLYFLGDEKLERFGVVEGVDLCKLREAGYIEYITNGLMLQLYRMELGLDLSQAHFRNRQLISSWLLEKGQENGSITIKTNLDGKTFFKITDFDEVNRLVGLLLGEIQKIKSTGDFESGKYLVEKYGTKVNQKLHKEVIERMSLLNRATKTGFITPRITPVLGEDGELLDFDVTNVNSFGDDQMYLSNNYSLEVDNWC